MDRVLEPSGAHEQAAGKARMAAPAGKPLADQRSPIDAVHLKPAEASWGSQAKAVKRRSPCLARRRYREDAAGATSRFGAGEREPVAINIACESGAGREERRHLCHQSRNPGLGQEPLPSLSNPSARSSPRSIALTRRAIKAGRVSSTRSMRSDGQLVAMNENGE